MPRPGLRSPGQPLPLRYVLGLLEVCGSVQLAVAVMGLLVPVLALGTILENRYNLSAAQFGIYDTWWFAALAWVLGVNVLCALVGRFPWNRRQIGFVVAHVGLLLLLVGCLLTRLYGIDSMVLWVFEGRASWRACQEVEKQDGQHFELTVLPEERTGGGPNPHAKPASEVAENEPIEIPFVAGPFNWEDYQRLPWFPWRLARRDRGVVYDRDGIRLEVLDYYSNSKPGELPKPLPFDQDGTPMPRRQAQVRLTVDGTVEEFWLAGSSDEPMLRLQGIHPPPNQRKVVSGNGRQVAIRLRPDELELGLQVYLRKARRKLEPGDNRKHSYYSSLIDLLPRDRETKPETPLEPGGNVPTQQDRDAAVRKDLLVEMNAPGDIADPRSGRSYRLFQSQMPGPWPPESLGLDPPEGVAPGPIYLSGLSVNYDPGRWPKYVGCLLIVLGIFWRYFGNWGRVGQGRETNGGASQAGQLTIDGLPKQSGKAATEAPPPSRLARPTLLVILAVFAAQPSLAAEPAGLNWDTWERLPVFAQSRVMPLDTFARTMVQRICGTTRPKLGLAGATLPEAAGKMPGIAAASRTFSPGELLFGWLVEPEKWEHIPCLRADDPTLRKELLELPLTDETGARLLYASPRQVQSARRFQERLDQLRKWQTQAAREGKPIEPTGVDEQAGELFQRYVLYRRLTFQPAAPSDGRRRFSERLMALVQNWQEVQDVLLRSRVAVDQSTSTDLAQETAEGLRKLASEVDRRGDEAPLAALEPPAAKLARSTALLAGRLADLQQTVRRPANLPVAQLHRFRAMLDSLAEQGREIARLAAETHLALYDDGDALRLVPALDAAALEADRFRGENQPWLSFQALIFGSDDLLRAYPQKPLHEVRRAYHQAAEAYRGRDDADRPQKFAAAMDQFASALAALGEAVEPPRKQLPIREKDDDLMAVTAYPPPGWTAVEVAYNRLDPFFWSWIVAAAAAGCLALSLATARRAVFWLGVAILVAALGLVIAGLSMRAAISGWMPVTGMFETMLLVVVTTGVLGLALALLPLRSLEERKPEALVGAVLSLVLLLAAYYVPAFPKDIKPLMAVLRSNFWLAIHVKTIMASYGAAFMALGLSLVALGHYLLGRYRRLPAAGGEGREVVRPPGACEVRGRTIYRSVQVAILLLAVGTILGALWADVSWGRFWGWDRKEVWALISLLVYMILVHLRHVGLAGHFSLAVGSVLGCIAVVWTYFLLRILMPGGMHAYAEDSAGARWVFGGIAVVLAFTLAAAVRYFGQTLSGRDAAKP